MPLISVIVPIYNVEKYLHKSVKSILNQTHKNLEIILVNDGSQDNSGLICDEFAKIDSRIKVIHQVNKGVSAARNAGLEVAKGDYIAFVDPDDFIAPDMYELLLKNLVKHNVDISICEIRTIDSNFNCIDGSDSTVEFHKVFSTYEAMESLCENKVINFSANNKLFKKYLFEKFRFREGIIFEDMDLIYKIIDISDKIFYTSVPKYNYVVQPNSILHRPFSKKRLESIGVYKEFLNFISKKYPSLLDKAKCYFLELCLINLFELLGSKSNFEKEKNELIYLTLKTYKEVSHSDFLNKKLKLKVFLLKINARLYYYFYCLFLKIKNKQ